MLNENNSMTQKEIDSRVEDIENQLESLFKKNLKITDWDVPEADDQKAAELIISILERKLFKIKENVNKGVYEYF